MNFATLGNTCVVGLQWGDEGKGKIVDVLTEHFDIVVRYAGGANAGHTVRIGEQKFALHLVPSGILRPGVTCVIAPGVVLDPETLLREIDGLRGRGVAIGDNLRISSRAHLVMPWHKKQDACSEAALSAETRLGTTSRGIGPCYAEKMMRGSALRAGDLLDADRFAARVRQIVPVKNQLFATLYNDREPLDADAISAQFKEYGARLKTHICDTTQLLHAALAGDARVLFEGAQGTLLDIDHGTFPFVTSSNCSATGVAAGAGVPAACVRSYVGVMKAYATRVGSGPFPTELKDQTGQYIRERGHEYGTTTGRPRRCGWFDAFAARYSIMLGGIHQVALMHLDTLGGLPEVRICTGYHADGQRLEFFSPDVGLLAGVQPIYETLPGWPALDTRPSPAGDPVPSTGAKAAAAGQREKWQRYEQLPAAARQYVERLEFLLGAPITLVSVGAERSATLHR